MNISYNWLKDLVKIELSPDDTAKVLTRVGFAVEGVHPHKDDFVLDIDLTSNRPDCLSHLGVARELTVSTQAGTRPVGTVAGSTSSESTSAEAVPNLLKIDNSDLCHRFTARIIRDVRIGPSPQWLVDRLEALGERSINNVADITNYVMLELGQPMHAFDLDKLAGSRIVVRTAKAGETIKTLDEVERKLEPSMLAICDADKPVAVAGVMGGFDSGITENTVNVLLEVAYFDRANIRATSRKLNLATEASYRFERGVDIENVVGASNRAAELIRELAGGEPAEFVDVYPRRFEAKEIVSNDISAAVLRLTGLDATREECDRILDSLGIKQRSKGIYVSPSWRHDLAIEEDLVEEAARHLGYDNIKDELPPAYGAGEYQETEHRVKLLRQRLVDLGFDEAISYSFIDERFDGMFQTAPNVLDDVLEEKYITLQDSVIEGAVRMRSTILPGLLDAVRLNLNHQRRDIRLFELGKVFAAKSGESGLPNEQEVLAIALTGGEMHEDRALAARPLDFYDVKGAVEVAMDSIRIDAAHFHVANVNHLRPGQSAEINVGGKTVGYIGRIADDIAALYKFRQPVFVAEINLQTLLDEPEDKVRYRPLSKYPAIVRDVSFLVKRNVEFGAIKRSIHDLGYELCRQVIFADVYEGKGVAEDERSITIRFEYRSDERTLVEDEVEQIHGRIVAEVQHKYNAEVRV